VGQDARPPARPLDLITDKMRHDVSVYTEHLQLCVNSHKTLQVVKLPASSQNNFQVGEHGDIHQSLKDYSELPPGHDGSLRKSPGGGDGAVYFFTDLLHTTRFILF